MLALLVSYTSTIHRFAWPCPMSVSLSLMMFDWAPSCPEFESWIAQLAYPLGILFCTGFCMVGHGSLIFPLCSLRRPMLLPVWALPAHTIGFAFWMRVGFLHCLSKFPSMFGVVPIYRRFRPCGIVPSHLPSFRCIWLLYTHPYCCRKCYSRCVGAGWNLPR